MRKTIAQLSHNITHITYTLYSHIFTKTHTQLYTIDRSESRFVILTFKRCFATSIYNVFHVLGMTEINHYTYYDG